VVGRRQLLLGVDIGTASSKGVLTDVRGRVVASASTPHGVSSPAPGLFEQDADGVWWADLVTLCRRLLATPGVEAGDVVGAGVSAIGPCVLPLDDADRPLRPGILYGIDARAGDEGRELQRLLAARGMRQTFSSQSVLPKLRWLQSHEPEIWARTRRVVGAEGYLVLRLTGRAVIDPYLAASYAPLLADDGQSWVPKLADLCPPQLLPELVWSTRIAGRVTTEAAASTGLRAGTPVVSGTADAAAEATSAGMSRPGDLMIMYGSTGFFILQCDHRPAPGAFWPGHFLEPDTYALAGGTNTLGSLTAWFRDEFAPEEVRAERDGGPAAFAALAQLGADSAPGARGLLALPYFAGERTPVDDPLARGAILGLTLAHTRADVYRALLEGIAYAIRDNVDRMAAEGFVPRRVLAVGGGARNQLLLQTVSDVTGLEQRVPAEVIGASLGDALRAGVGVGVFGSLAAAAGTVEHRRVVVPDRGLAAMHGERFAMYRELFACTRSLAHRLAGAGGPQAG
jgi:xylulokinase